MKEKEFLQNVNKLIEMILKNAGHSFGLDFGLINEMGIEVKKRLEIVKED